MHDRIKYLFLGFLFCLALIILRLSYWQVVKGSDLSGQARDQYAAKDVTGGQRGGVITADGFPLVINQAIFTLVPICLPSKTSLAL